MADEFGNLQRGETYLSLLSARIVRRLVRLTNSKSQSRHGSHNYARNNHGHQQLNQRKTVFVPGIAHLLTSRFTVAITLPL